jgi:energy-coupling factor transporter transmembrane protein EcfT
MPSSRRSRRAAWTCRGGTSWSGRYVPLMVPLMTHVIRQTLLLAMALEAKGFDPSATRVRADESRFTAADYVVLAGLAVLLLLCLWLWWNGYGVVGGVGF